MSFDHVNYVSNHPLPASQAWSANFSWLNLILVSPTELRVTNTDGSVTVFTGTGFTLNSLGYPSGGDVTLVERFEAGRSTAWESFEFRDGADPGNASITRFVASGIGPWMTAGDDSYTIKPGVLLNELPGVANGIDTITLLPSADTTYVIPANVENVIYSGSAAFLARGNDLSNSIQTGSGNDTLIGGNGNDTLDGGAGNDLMSGGTGDDTYVVDSTGDKVNELAGQGNDTIRMAFSTYTLAANLENVTYTGSGTAVLTGNSAANILEGGAGADTLTGGLGNDTYVADTSDIIVELNNQGIDSVKTIAASFTLGNFVENLTFFSAVPDAPPVDRTGTGNELANVLTGELGTDTLYGLAGNDSLDGLKDAFVDTLTGGLGNDTYTLHSTEVGAAETHDIIIELAGEGIDLVESYLSTTVLAANVENLNLKGTSALFVHVGIGNDLNNVIRGTFDSDRLDGGAGNDTLQGGFGDDIYVIDTATDVLLELSAQGSDTVETGMAAYSLGLNLENIRFVNDGVAHTGTGNSAVNYLFGAGGSDILNGLGGADYLDGGAGADMLNGGTDDDTYIIDNAGDVVTEIAGQGTDTVKTEMASHTLAVNVENLIIGRFDPKLGAAISHTGTGNAHANMIKGDAAGDTLSGLGGDDTLDGGEVFSVPLNIFVGDDASDILIGGLGNDTYVVRDAQDILVENANEGTDTVVSHLDSFTLAANFENITIADDYFDQYHYHSATGNAANNKLTGDVSNDTLDGGAGNDTMAGGAGNDNYYVDTAGDTIVELAGQGFDTVHTALLTYTLGTNLEGLDFQGTGTHTGYGNTVGNWLGGGDGNDTLYGLGGDDTLSGGLADGYADKLVGGAGNDTYYLTDTTAAPVLTFIDVITEGASEGTHDRAVTMISGYTLAKNVEDFGAENHIGVLTATGSAGANIMEGNYKTYEYFWLHESGSEIFYGLGGDDYLDSGHDFDALHFEIADHNIDMLYGGIGNDTYVVWDTFDTVVEGLNEGTDLVLSHAFATTLSDNVEKLTLIGHQRDENVQATGNLLANTITGDQSNDTIDGGAGNDTMAGGAGNDIYIVDSLGDIVTELTGFGTDTVLTGLAKYTIAANVENVDGTGTVAQTLTGNALNNHMSGGTAADTLAGLLGDDTYFVEAGDIVLENSGQGTDKVETELASYTLTANVENLAYHTSIQNAPHAAFTGTGNSLANTITGGDASDHLYGLFGNDRLEGGLGDDVLFGGAGNDVLLGDARSKDGAFHQIQSGNPAAGIPPDTLQGHFGNDTFAMTAGDGRDEVLDFRGAATGGGDHMAIYGVAAMDTWGEVQAAMTQTAAGVSIAIDVNTSVLFKGLAIADLGAGDFLFTAP